MKNFISFLLLGAACLAGLAGCGGQKQQKTEDVTDRLQLTEYEAGAGIGEAVGRLETTDGACELIAAQTAKQRKASLVFLGLCGRAQTEQICTMLAEYDVPALFLVDGMAAAEDRETVEMIAREGFEIGNYSLSAERRLQEKSEEEIAASFAHAQVILRAITGDEPRYCGANATKWDERMLHAAYCAGLKTAVSPSAYVANVSFPTFNAAMGYVKELWPGEIIAVKLNDTLDETEYEPFKQKGGPATDFGDALQEAEPEEEPNTDIVVTVRYLLEALQATETAVVPVDRLHLDFDAAVEQMFEVLDDIKKYEPPEHDAVEDAWFDHALFIGDSLTLALSTYPLSLPETTRFCAYKSITPKQFADNVVVKNEDGTETAVFDRICEQEPKNIFILLGTNVLASDSNENLIATYQLLLQKLREQFADVPIYIQGLPPVTEAAEAERVTLTNNRIKKVNLRLGELAEQTGCCYIDLYTALANENGKLSTYFSQEDGIHLNIRGCQKWLEYLKEHVTAEDQGEPDEDSKADS